MDFLQLTSPVHAGRTAAVYRNNYRVLCVLAGLLNLAFGSIYFLSDPAATDPLWLRVAFSTALIVLPVISYFVNWVEHYFIALAHTSFYLITGYIITLTALNDFSPNYSLGALFAVTGFGLIFSLGSKHIGSLVAYLGTAVIMYIGAFFLSPSPQANPVLVSVTVFSTALVIFVVARAKLRAERVALQTAQRNQTLERYQTLIDAANDAIVIADPETGQLIEANDKAREFFGCASDEIRSMTLSDLHPPDEQSDHIDLYNTYTADNRTNDDPLHIVDAEGNLVPVDVSASLIAVEEGQLIQAIFRDITDRQAYQQQLIAAKERAEELLRLKSSFLNNMSHELRTPLTSILGYAETLDEEIDGSAGDFAGYIAESAKRLQDTLNSVLDLARLESGEVTLDLERIDVAAEVQSVAELLRPVADQKDLMLQVDVPAEGCYVKADSACINRITNNLVSNALKFTEEGGVTVCVERNDAVVKIVVSDTGIGISPEFQEHLFDEFRQESTGLQRSHEGSGLGLTITKRLVDLLGGHIDVDSTQGAGSTFTVQLPHAEAALPSSDSSTAPTETAPAVSGTVLVVEDNEMTQELVEHYLQDAPHVDVVATPDDALASAETTVYDLVIIDIHLKTKRNGIDILQALRERDAYDNTPMVALTAYAMPEDRERFLNAGFDYYISKPFAKEELLETLNEALAARTDGPSTEPPNISGPAEDVSAGS